jgi:hypothetical protein
MPTGYLSIADLPGEAKQVIITGTGLFEAVPFLGGTLFELPEGPCLVTAQLYFYPVTGSPRPTGMMLQVQRGSGDPTADDAIVWPTDWPFGYIAKSYVSLDYVKAGNLTRGIRLAVPLNKRVALRTHVLKVENAAAYIAARITPAED